MIFSRESDRTITFNSESTPARVGPGRYAETPKPVKRIRKKLPFQERQTFPRPDINTPGPGSYESPNVQSRAITSCFKSRSERDRIKPDINVSPADYSQLNEWGRPRTVYQCYRPPKKIQPKVREAKVQRGNYLDKKGRIIYVPPIVHTEEDIGPGTYDITINNYSGNINLNKTAHKLNLNSSENTPSPTEYNPLNTDSRIPIAIKEKHKERVPDWLSKDLPQPPKERVNTRKNPEFKSTTKRFDEKINETPPPGAYYNDNSPSNLNRASYQFRNTRNRFHDLPPSTASIGTLPLTKIEKRPSPQFLSRSVNFEAQHDTPGPGTYDAPPPKTNGVNPLKSSTVRFPPSTTDIPGPCDYSPIQDEKKDTKIINSRHPNYNDWSTSSMTSAPSPQHYTINRELQRQPHSIHTEHRFREERPSDGPDPCTYHTEGGSFVKRSYNIYALPKGK